MPFSSSLLVLAVIGHWSSVNQVRCGSVLAFQHHDVNRVNQSVTKAQQKRMEAELDEHARAADVAVAAGAPEQRPRRAAYARANEAMDAMEQRAGPFTIRKTIHEYEYEYTGFLTITIHE